MKKEEALKEASMILKGHIQQMRDLGIIPPEAIWKLLPLITDLQLEAYEKFVNEQNKIIDALKRKFKKGVK